MPALVTGATGFIGRRLVRRLVADGDRVRALVLPDEPAGVLGTDDAIEVARGDITDPEAVARAVAGCDRVYHLAAVVGDWGDPALFEAVNVGGTRNVLEAAAAAGVDRLLMVSSVVVYGWRVHTGVCDEEAPREFGVSPYSRTKRASEELALDYHELGRLPVTVVRPGNVYGVGSGLWVDEPVSLLRKGQMLLIDGGGGDAALAHVDNVVDVIARAAQSEAAAGRIYNANDGAGVSWRDYFSDLAQVAGVSPPRRSIPSPVALVLAGAMERAWRLLRRSGRPLLTREAVTLLASRAPVPVDRARSELGYEPVVTYDDAIHQIAEYVHGQ